MYDNLYNSLIYNISMQELSADEKDEILNLVKDINEEQKEIIYYFILHDWNLHNPNTKVVYPYSTKQLDHGIEIKLDCLPIRLKRVLYKFLKLAHTQAESSPLIMTNAVST